MSSAGVNTLHFLSANVWNKWVYNGMSGLSYHQQFLVLEAQVSQSTGAE